MLEDRHIALEIHNEIVTHSLSTEYEHQHRRTVLQLKL